MRVRQNPKDHERYEDQVYDVSPVRRGGRSAGFTKLPPPGSVADARTQKPNAVLVALRVEANGGTSPPRAFKEPETFTKSESHSFANLSHRVQSDRR